MESVLHVDQVTGLSREQCAIILDIAKNLQVMADISQADMFIDCLLPEGNAAIIVAEAHPNTAQSLYKNSVLGQIVLEENEPGVLFSLKTGKPVIGSRGLTQEHIMMQQDIVPIIDASGVTVAVLIKEQDISQTIQNEQRVKLLTQTNNSKEKQHVIQSMIIQEIHHRVKNNLQVISSLLRLQMRRSSSEEVIEVFRDSVSRISSMAMVHDYLAQNGIEEVDVAFVMGQIATLLVSSSSTPEQHIDVSVQGEQLFLPSNRATSAVLVVNELIQNSIKHAFPSRDEGKVEICINCRKQMVTITVSDNGCGTGDTTNKFIDNEAMTLWDCSTE